MALERQERVVVRHAVAVVDDADHALAAGFDFDADRSGTGVDGVFEQFFNDGGRALDDFARGDAVGDSFREDADAAHAPADLTFAVGVGPSGPTPLEAFVRSFSP